MCNEMSDSQSIFEKELDPTFLYAWKGIRTQNEDSYHSHDYIEIAFILSGKNKYRIDDNVYDIAEGDFLILNPGVKHQAIAIGGNSSPSTEFIVAFSDIWLRNYPENIFPLPDRNDCIFHATGQLYQKLFKLCASMEAENAAHRQGHYEMMKSYLVQMLLLIIREQYEPVKNTG